MPEKKNQHYVPKFYLQNFSKNGRSINLFNISNNRIIIGDSIKNQCAEDYFYSKESIIENAFGNIETLSSKLLKRIITERYIPVSKTQDHSLLQLFVVMLHSRTKYVYDEQNEMVDKLAKSVLKLHPQVEKESLNKVTFNYDNPLQLPLFNAFTGYHLAQDLGIHLFQNKTDTNFITSDHPVIFYNKWTEEVKDYGAIGLASKGLLIFLPLSSKTMLILYDGSVYKIGYKKDFVTELENPKEIENMNILQWLCCRDNIYFLDEENQNNISTNAQKYIPLRNKNKIQLQERGFTNKGKLIGFHGTKLKTKLEVGAIKIIKPARAVKVEDRILSVRNPKLRELVREFSEKVSNKEYNASEWNKYIEDIVKLTRNSSHLQ